MVGMWAAAWYCRPGQASPGRQNSPNMPKLCCLPLRQTKQQLECQTGLNRGFAIGLLRTSRPDGTASHTALEPNWIDFYPRCFKGRLYSTKFQVLYFAGVQLLINASLNSEFKQLILARCVLCNKVLDTKFSLGKIKRLTC